MENKTKLTILEILTFFYLVLFPFGQVIRWDLLIGTVSFPFHPTDFIVGLIFACCLAFKIPRPPIFRLITNFLAAATFSLIFSIVIFKSWEILLGGLYLLRIYAYSYLLIAAWNVYREQKLKDRLLVILLAISGTIAVFGWFQYFFYPDFRPLVEWGWDDHLYRLVGTFMDPAFTSIVIVFGYILSLTKYLFSKNKSYLALILFFTATLAFTYSRAGYLAFTAGSIAILLAVRKIRIVIPVLGLLFIIFLLPRPEGEGVKLERVASIFARGNNYVETLQIAGHSPLLGVGFNNLCLARQKYLGQGEFGSHSCSGSDSSILFVLATTGIVGLFIFLAAVYGLYRNLSGDIYGTAVLGALVALGVHGFFSNSYFYPWVMGYVALLWSLTIKGSS
jgi:hypothetical protein